MSILEAVHAGNLALVAELKVHSNIPINKLLIWACETTHIHVINWLIDNGANSFAESLSAACRYNRIAVMDLLTARGAADWDHAMCETMDVQTNNAAREWLVDHGANSWSLYLEMAISTGNVHVVEWMADRGFNMPKLIMGALHYRNRPTIAWCIRRGYTTPTHVAMIATIADEISLIDWASTQGTVDYDTVFINAIKHNRTATVSWILARHTVNINAGLIRAASYGHLNIVKMLTDSGATAFAEAVPFALYTEIRIYLLARVQN